LWGKQQLSIEKRWICSFLAGKCYQKQTSLNYRSSLETQGMKLLTLSSVLVAQVASSSSKKKQPKVDKKQQSPSFRKAAVGLGVVAVAGAAAAAYGHGGGSALVNSGYDEIVTGFPQVAEYTRTLVIEPAVKFTQNWFYPEIPVMLEFADDAVFPEMCFNQNCKNAFYTHTSFRVHTTLSARHIVNLHRRAEPLNANVEAMKITSYEILKDLPLNTVSVDLSGARITSEELKYIGHLENLQFLFLDGCKNIDSIPADLHLPNLKVLKMRGSVIEDITALANFKKLRILYLSGASKISDISALAELDKLQVVDLSGLRLVKSIEALRNKPHLKTLVLHKSGVTDYSPVSGNVNLKLRK
jgi:hypothetical protein